MICVPVIPFDDSRWRGLLLRRLTDDEIAELLKLHAARYEADKAFDDFLEAHRFEIPATPNQKEKRNT